MNPQVYVIGSVGSPLVKIGTSKNFRARRKALQSASPLQLRVLWTVNGGYDLEQAIHTKLAKYRKHGEWFNFGRKDPIRVVKRTVQSLVPTGAGGPYEIFVTDIAGLRPISDLAYETYFRSQQLTDRISRGAFSLLSACTYRHNGGFYFTCETLDILRDYEPATTKDDLHDCAYELADLGCFAWDAALGWMFTGLPTGEQHRGFSDY